MQRGKSAFGCWIIKTENTLQDGILGMSRVSTIEKFLKTILTAIPPFTVSTKKKTYTLHVSLFAFVVPTGHDPVTP